MGVGKIPFFKHQLNVVMFLKITGVSRWIMLIAQRKNKTSIWRNKFMAILWHIKQFSIAFNLYVKPVDNPSIILLGLIWWQENGAGKRGFTRASNLINTSAITSENTTTWLICTLILYLSANSLLMLLFFCLFFIFKNILPTIYLSIFRMGGA